MTDDEKARAEQARRLREEIEHRTKQPSTPPPRTPREFVEERMRKLAKEPTQESEDETHEEEEEEEEPRKRERPGDPGEDRP